MAQINREGLANSYQKAMDSLKNKKITAEDKGFALTTLKALGTKSDDILMEDATNVKNVDIYGAELKKLNHGQGIAVISPNTRGLMKSPLAT